MHALSGFARTPRFGCRFPRGRSIVLANKVKRTSTVQVHARFGKQLDQVSWINNTQRAV